jgi:hypothetical protein
MASSFRQLAVNFSTADAERPVLEYHAGILTVRFVDWEERDVLLQFPEVAGFRWQDEEGLPPGARDDVSYEIMDSPWVDELRRLGAAGVEHRHIKLCFHAAGVLDIVSEAFTEGQ